MYLYAVYAQICMHKEQCYCYTAAFYLLVERGWLVHCNDGPSCVASLKISPLSLSLSFPLSFLASLPPRGIFLLTGGAVKFEWFSSGFDAVTSHPLRELKAIKLLQMSRHQHSEMYQVAKPGASCPSPCPMLHFLSYRMMVCCNQSCDLYKV